jgi:outer membrane porin, OprD family
MKIRTSRGERTCLALAVLILMSGINAVFGQQPNTAATATPGAADSSVEQGHTEVDQMFDFREFQLKTRQKALEDTKFEFNFRTYYFDRHQFDGSNSQAWAAGGWFGLKTGYFLDHIALGATVYTSQPVLAGEDRDGTLLLRPGQHGYTVLGEAYADIRIVNNLNLSIGRKGYDTPFINRNDTRMTPNTFEAIVLQGKVEFDEPAATVPVNKDGMALSTDGKDAPVLAPSPKPDLATLKYGAGFFHQIKERNNDIFVSMAKDAGANVERGVYTAGVIYEKGKFSIGGIDYYCDDIINIGYGETKFEIPLSEKVRPRIAAQFVDQRSTGNDLLQGSSFSVQQYGLKAELPVQNVLFTAAFTHASGDANLRNPWSGYPGYTSVQVQDFNRAGESAFLFRIGYDFPQIDGLSAYALAVFGTDPDAAGSYRQDEYDVNLQWAPKKSCLKGLSVRVRYAVVDQHGGNVDNLTDFRAIVNYVIKF